MALSAAHRLLAETKHRNDETVVDTVRTRLSFSCTLECGHDETRAQAQARNDLTFQTVYNSSTFGFGGDGAPGNTVVLGHVDNHHIARARRVFAHADELVRFHRCGTELNVIGGNPEGGELRVNQGTNQSPQPEIQRRSAYIERLRELDRDLLGGRHS